MELNAPVGIFKALISAISVEASPAVARRPLTATSSIVLSVICVSTASPQTVKSAVDAAVAPSSLKPFTP